ncbi:ATP-binding protein [Flavobacterium sp. HJSW_4]|uniref:ATP-binding protein n=1 Tax=Flavobacterium sp. HJSW_4 TaxID=3344660 RepID=UPI0035F307D8
MNNLAPKYEPLKWRFDVNAFRLLGRDLITDRITAVFELVKNAYDANATEVIVTFSNVNNQTTDSTISIKDNGTGMSLDDIRDKWMVVGTNSKRKNLYSDSPFNRRYVGEKGIGRFAVDKLGEKVEIITKQSNTNEGLIVKLHWDEYETKAASEQLTLFTEVENDYSYFQGDITEHGTELLIKNLNEPWTKSDIDRLYKELTKIVSPFYPLSPPFNIYVDSNDFSDFNKRLVEVDIVKYASHTATISFDIKTNEQETLKFNSIKGEIYTEKIPIQSFGPVSMNLFFFNTKAKRIFNQAFKGDETRIDGVKIYRDGLVTTPFAEYNDHPDNKRDVLGIDKRLWRDIFNRISTREVIGIVSITKEENPKIIDATNRQDFVDNNEYRELKKFVIEQLNIFSEIKVFERIQRQDEGDNALKKADDNVQSFSQAIQKLEIEKPDLKVYLQPLKKKAAEVSTSLKKGISAQKEAKQEYVRKENIYLSLMSLQDYAIRLSHAVRTSLGKTKRMAEFFKNKFPNARFDDVFKDYAVLIYDEMETLNKVIDFMLSYAGSNIDFEDFSIKKMLNDLLLKSYKQTFLSENINALIEFEDDLIINANRKFFEDIFQNFISNSIKALETIDQKIIKCSGKIIEDQFVIYFSDNGIGISKDKWKKVFEIYYTSTAEQGGAGLGLFIVKTRIEALHGKVEIIDSEFGDCGATFKITLPFKKG